MVNHNWVSANALLFRAGKALKDTPKRPQRELANELRRIADIGIPTEFQFNNYRIKYMVKVQGGEYKPNWVVVNAILGTKKRFFTVDFMGNRGGVYWHSLAKAMTRI